MNKPEKYAVLFGFCLDDKEKTGYLKILEKSCAVVSDKYDASRFSLDEKQPGWRPPSDWCRFFKDEPSVSRWRFHPVILTKTHS